MAFQNSPDAYLFKSVDHNMGEVQTPKVFEVKKKIADFNYFDDWDEETILELCKIAIIKNFKSDEIILGGKNDFKSYVYFVTEGTCGIIECVHLPEETSFGIRTRASFVNVCILNRLSCFNIGENLENRQIIAITRVQCLLIPFYWLLEENRANIWVRIKQFLTWNIPKAEEIVQNLLNQKKWKRHRKKVCRAKMKRKVDTISSQQVPYSLKVTSYL